MYRSIGLIALMLAMPGAGGCVALVVAGGASHGASTTADDSTITANVETRLRSSKAVDAGGIGVDTNNGIVTLRGTVESRRASEQAEALAADANGVKNVVNKLEVKPESGG